MTKSPLKIAILGAASGIAQATARIYAQEGAELTLLGRNENHLNEIAADLRLKGAKNVETLIVDFTKADPVKTLNNIKAQMGGLDHILICYGIMSEQSEAENDPELAQKMIEVNFASTSAWALASANLLEEENAGSLIVLGSVAGDRGRRSNYIYGASKAGIEILVQGIAHRFAGKGVKARATLIKPGPTDTAMTAGMEKGGFLWATPEQVAKVIRKSADKGAPIVYAPRRWQLIMLIISFIPSFVFNKMNF